MSSTSRQIETPAGIKPADIYFVLFRHKWKIIILTLLGLAGGAGFFFTQKPTYQSDAEVFIRYVSDTSPVSPTENNSRTVSQIDQGPTVINSEIAMLRSLDLAKQVATNVGVEKILAKAGGGNDATAAALLVEDNLKVDPIRESCVLYLTFRHPDPEVVGPILTDLIKDYQEMHAKVRGFTGYTEDALAEQASQLHMQLMQTEEELRMAKTNAGIISVAGAETSYENELARIRSELFEARASLAEHHVSLRAPAGDSSPKTPASQSATNVPADELSHYKSICAQLNYLSRKQNEYIQQGYTPENKLVQENQDRQSAMTKSKTALESKFPSLSNVDVPGPATDVFPTSPEASESAQVAALTLKIQELQAQFDEVQAAAAKLNDAATKISDLESRKKQQQEYYDHFVSMKDQANIDDVLGPGRANIQLIQQPSPPYKNNSKIYKTAGILAMSGLLLGLAWAFLIEFYLDRSVKRPVDLHGKLRIPFFLSIPDLNHGQRNRLAASERRQLAFNGNGNGHGEPDPVVASGALVVASPAVNHALSSHYDALRDRLVSYFESINLTRKPKLVAVTSAGKGAGVSTISAGLAASLSETGDGRVLLVDMNLENGAAQQFIHGKPGCQLDDALAAEKRDHALVQENLYVVSEGSNADKLPRFLPKRFSSLIPKLRASDYDYIIFDMPPVTQTSVTTRLAGFMDTVMLVVESEKTDRDVVQQANQLLLQSKANVTAVLNKTRSYIPARLQADIHADI